MIIPDIMSTAKGISSGYISLGGVAISVEIQQILSEKIEGTLFSIIIL